jgi:hypothetical protein
MGNCSYMKQLIVMCILILIIGFITASILTISSHVIRIIIGMLTILLVGIVYYFLGYLG